MLFYLIGFMGSGKSTIAETIKQKYGVHIIHLDEVVERREGMRISEIFHSAGEDEFRARENEALRKLAKYSWQESVIVDCGGGIVLNEDNVEIMRSTGKIIYLKTKSDVLLKRVYGDRSRPLLPTDEKEAKRWIKRELERRSSLYESASNEIIRTDRKGIDETVEAIMEIINRNSKEQ